MTWTVYSDAATRSDGLHLKVSGWATPGVPRLVDVQWIGDQEEFTHAEVAAIYPECGVGPYDSKAQQAYMQVKMQSGRPPVIAIPWGHLDMRPLMHKIDGIVALRRSPPPGQNDPRMAALEARMQALETAVAALGRRLRGSATP